MLIKRKLLAIHKVQKSFINFSFSEPTHASLRGVVRAKIHLTMSPLPLTTVLANVDFVNFAGIPPTMFLIVTDGAME